MKPAMVAMCVATCVAMCVATSVACVAHIAGAQAAQPPAVLAVSPTSTAARSVRIAFHTIGGDSVRIGAHESATLVAVFATWCRSCREEVSVLNQLQRDLAAQHVRVVAVNVDKTSPESIRRWLDGVGAMYPVALDESGEIGRTLGAVGVPEFHLISADGRVVYSRRGPITSSLTALRNAVVQLSGS